MTLCSHLGVALEHRAHDRERHLAAAGGAPGAPSAGGTTPGPAPGPRDEGSALGTMLGHHPPASAAPLSGHVQDRSRSMAAIDEHTHSCMAATMYEPRRIQQASRQVCTFRQSFWAAASTHVRSIGDLAIWVSNRHWQQRSQHPDSERMSMTPPKRCDSVSHPHHMRHPTNPYCDNVVRFQRHRQ